MLVLTRKTDQEIVIATIGMEADRHPGGRSDSSQRSMEVYDHRGRAGERVRRPV